MSELFDAMGAVLAGTTFVSPSLVTGMLHALTAPPKEEPRLTSRQQEILRLLASGKSIKEVAASLDLTPRTVASQKYRIMRKLHLSTSAELVRFAVEQRLV
ncbi:MAG TPA: response regulator transcription factor [Vicinamibacterales bacterium]|nr:response regulator transcription factor [Vicinamibacterales bacterium]